jgi:hypothetical protein
VAGFLALLALLWVFLRRRVQRPQAPRKVSHAPVMVRVFLHPETHEYVSCPNCNGYGSDVLDMRKHCALCHGWGVVPKKHRRVTEVA